MDAFEIELKTFFLQEAQQLVAEAEQYLLQLENNSHDESVIDAIFRIAHNIKGSSRGVGLTAIGDFTHVLESALLKVKQKEIPINAATVGLLLECNDFLKTSVETLIANHSDERTNPDLLSRLEALLRGEIPGGTAAVEEAAPAPHLHVVPSTSTPPPPTAAPKTDENIRVGLKRVDELINDVGELVILQTVLMQQRHLIQSPLLQNTIMQLNKITKNIQDKSTSLRMVSMKSTFQKMQRIVRDTSSALSKEINFIGIGEDSEIDKTVADQINDPLVHIIRNACDHALETPEARVAAGKPKAGMIQLAAYHKGGSMVIEVRDDGKGLNVEVIRRKAIEKGLIKEDSTMSDGEIHRLIFHPGFSTKTEITDLSGRGVGLDVVKTNVERLKGQIEIETSVGIGTTFRIVLPLTLAIIDGMVLRINGDERYVLPSNQVVEVVQPESADVECIADRDDVLKLRGETLPLFKLDAVLGRSKSKRPATSSVAIIGHTGTMRFALLTDEVIGKQQIVIKQLGQDMARVRGISGGAILGDGRAALILDLNEIVQAR